MPAFCSVVFDCDSTLSSIEGIDELAREHRGAIEPLTEAAMRGELPLEAVYGQRLAIIQPSRAEVERVGARYVETLVDGARETISALRGAGVEVRIISGGLRPAVLQVARVLGVLDELVFAVDISFDAEGRYVGFDEASPLAHRGGKATIIRSWTNLPRPAMMVGDGATDLEAKDAVECFVAFAGVAERPNVVAEADAVVRDRSLLPLIALAVDGVLARESSTQQLAARSR